MNTRARRNPSLFIAAIVLITLSYNFSFAQLKDKTLSNYTSVKELFYADPLVFYNNKDSANARLDFYLEIPYDGIQFKKSAAATKDLVSNLTYSIKVTSDLNQAVINETRDENISIPSADSKTYKDDSKFIVQSFPLKPGTYSAVVTLKDNNSKKELTKTYPFKVIDHSADEIFASDMMIVSNYEIEASGKKKITPSVNNNLGVLKDFYVFFEVYSAKTTNTDVSYTYFVTDSKNDPITLETNKYTLYPGVNKIIEKLSSEKIMIGDFKMEVKDNSSGKILISKNVTNRWTDFPVAIKDIDVAISQLQYIATSEEMDKLKSAKTNGEKEKKFIEFWKKKDPSPNTPRNELMIEYYNRIRIANERYSHYNDGWRTDMGMVYIIYGNPSNIDRHPFENQTKPYEVWDYYDINRQFVFVDDSGFGDYRLITPIYDDFRFR
ncbi:MAG: GWxTD domain-containing protein [Bacteroidetes bacterium]|nr:GWxTD domain-containing protein [Bacteroidota bacterium]